jgi:hypothetical protein
MPLEFFLSSDLKSLLYRTRPRTIDDFEENIRATTTDITPQTLERVRGSVQHRINLCEQKGEHQFENLFH